MLSAWLVVAASNFLDVSVVGSVAGVMVCALDGVVMATSLAVTLIVALAGVVRAELGYVTADVSGLIGVLSIAVRVEGRRLLILFMVLLRWRLVVR